ncbi:MAG TPA: hypothetical protein DCZ94_10115 [Lentisphaeria bacterium]|nr:MAG: hypothetical protein A2X48_08525 [Lentisphaerae bacterium GWF2_49_21]HBC87299.1 hypothetical protein [Lentisphaeria bacterium]
MKLDKETIIVLSICFVLLIIWPYLFSVPKQPQPETQPQNIESKGKAAPSDSSISPAGANGKELKKPEPVNKEPLRTEEIKKDASVQKTEKTGKSEDEIKLPEIPDQIISNDCISFKINPAGGYVSSIEFKKFLTTDKKKTITLNEDFDPGALSFSTAGKLKTTSLECLKENENTLKVTRGFRNEAGRDFTVVQTWKILEKYKTDYRIQIINSSKEKLSVDGIRVSAGSIIPVLELSGDYFMMETHCISTCLENTVASKSASADKPFEELQENAASWIAVSNKYFACILKPETPFKKGEGNVLRQIIKTMKDEKGKEKSYSSIETYGVIEKIELEPASEASLGFTYFSGPKELALVKEFDPKASEIMYLGWAWFEPISQGFLVALIWLKKFCGSYGLSIILLTFIVKMIFWPVTDRANASMRKMQKIQPLVQEIKTKYKDDSQKMNQKIMQLYKEHKVNPLGGCLPILLQIPVFTALYFSLNGAIELRQSSFLWAFDLSRPDTIYTIPGIELAINPLVILMAVTMVYQQHLTPSAMDPMQQKMMMIMPLVMLVLLYSLPSGLTLYWTISQGISIVQLLVNKRIDEKEKSLEKKNA